MQAQTPTQTQAQAQAQAQTQTQAQALIQTKDKSQDFMDAQNSYYKLKEAYEDKYNKAKMKIIKNQALSTREKQQKFKQIKQNCIYCKKDGGSIFTN